MTSENTMYGDMGVGSHVYTSDGDDLGTIKEVQGRFFKVDASMRPDYWLSRDCVRTASVGEVRLAIDKDQLGDYKVDKPSTL